MTHVQTIQMKINDDEYENVMHNEERMFKPMRMNADDYKNYDEQRRMHKHMK